MTTFNYNRNDVHYGIVHFGVGNFHRAHLEYYTNLLMEDKDQQQWGVFGAMIMPSDQRLYKALKEDDGISAQKSKSGHITVQYPCRRVFQ